MEKKTVSFKIAAFSSEGKELKLAPTEQLSAMKANAVQAYLKKIVTSKGTHLEIDLSGIHDIDNEWFDTFNLLSRLARKYDSSVTLIGVEPEIMELIELIRKYYFFDIKVIQPAL